MTDGFSDQFTHYLAPSTSEIRSALTDGMTVLDANVLLSAYRYAPSTRAELLDVLERIGDRIFIPHQVALEFHRNRHKVMAGHLTAYDDVLKEISTYESSHLSLLSQKVQEFANRTALVEEEKAAIIDDLAAGLRSARTRLQELRRTHHSSQPAEADPVLERLRQILSGKVGEPFADETIPSHLLEAKRRTENKIPPGYEDAADKEDSHGDYFLWAQALSEAKRRAARFLLLVTDDQKEDWFFRVKGKTLMARPELAEEAAISGTRLLIMSTRSFLEHSKVHLAVQVSDETIRQAGVIPERLPSKAVLVNLREVVMLVENERRVLKEQMEIASASRSRIANTLRELRAQELADDQSVEAIKRAEKELRQQNLAVRALRDRWHRMKEVQNWLHKPYVPSEGIESAPDRVRDVIRGLAERSSSSLEGFTLDRSTFG